MHSGFSFMESLLVIGIVDYLLIMRADERYTGIESLGGQCAELLERTDAGGSFTKFTGFAPPVRQLGVLSNRHEFVLHTGAVSR